MEPFPVPGSFRFQDQVRSTRMAIIFIPWWRLTGAQDLPSLVPGWFPQISLEQSPDHLWCYGGVGSPVLKLRSLTHPWFCWSIFNFHHGLLSKCPFADGQLVGPVWFSASSVLMRSEGSLRYLRCVYFVIISQFWLAPCYFKSLVTLW